MTGKSHKCLGLPNQDTYATARLKGVFVAAVSDGLGSRELSSAGSRAAVNSVVTAAKIINASTDGVDIIRIVHAIWRTKIIGSSAKDYACTCLFVLRFDSGRVFAAALGDGIISVENGGKRTALELSEKEFANSTDALDTCKLSDWRTLDEHIDGNLLICLASDGVSDDIEDGSIFDFARFVAEQISGDQMSQRDRNNYILKLLNRWTRPFSNDDKTLLVIKEIK